MAYCGQCGQKNPDGAAFCSACGAKLQMSDTPEENPASRPGSFRVNIPHRDGTPPRRETAPPRREAAPPAQDRWPGSSSEHRPNREPDNANGTNRAGRNKGGKVGGCLKRMLLWVIGLIVVAAVFGLGVSKCKSGDGQGGNGDKGNNDDMSNIEQVMTKSALDSLMEKNSSFEKDNGDVVPRPGRYEGKAMGQRITFDVKPEQNGKILGKVHVEMDGETIRDCIYAYCGNGIYSMYFGEAIYDEPYEYFQALPDHETISYKNGYTDITVTYQGPIKGQEDSGDTSESYTESVESREDSGDGSAISNITKCIGEERLASIIQREGFPETNENHALKYGTYNVIASKGGKPHRMSIRLERYYGSNQLIVAKVSWLGDGKEIYRGYVGYCGSSIYALYLKDADVTPYKEEDIKMNESTADYIYANSDGSISMYWDGKEQLRLRQGENAAVELNG